MKWLIVLAALVAVAWAGLAFLAREAAAPSVPVPPDATGVLDDPRFAEPDGWEWQRLPVADGDIRWGLSGSAQAPAVVIFLPGYSAPVNIYFETFSRLRAEGYAVAALDWPGQAGSSRGTDNPEKIHARSLDGHVDAGLSVVAEVLQRFPERPIHLVGLSMGAQIGTRMLANEPGLFASAALITPAYGLYDNRPSAAEQVMLRALSVAGFGQRYVPGSTDWVYDMDVHELKASRCSHPNARTRLWYAWMVADPTLRVGGMSNDFLLAMIAAGRQAAAPETLERLTLPIWMPTAENDVFVDNATAEAVCAALPNCTGQRYAQARHCLFEEDDRFYEPFINDLVEFLAQHTTTG